MEAYCMKCKTKREIQEPVAAFNAKGSPVTLELVRFAERNFIEWVGRQPMKDSRRLLSRKK